MFQNRYRWTRQNPELAAKLAEYQALRQKSMIWNIPAIIRQQCKTRPSKFDQKLGELMISRPIWDASSRTQLRGTAIKEMRSVNSPRDASIC